ncbi:MAG: FtsQ-type POTRA domain-containing protein [Gemmatimonadales bacterium]|nr:FtsQ-type POTRA domain-containing protein [Gemmatimonadales bacterium]MYG50014.1 FtsQ-type POTRA domain-containing protein [Gemmatimonadales bacterium]MYK02170.1 FtsQ-type POTRA domain-containing protein [Candidatus Palauibacter ramosifaciens]
MIKRRPSRRSRITRRGRRRLFFALTVAAIGLSVSIWVPPLLATLPAFQISEVHVVGTEHVPPEEIRALALTPDASAWDDPATLEARVRAHPMVREATARRQSFRTLEIAIVERRPVALVATPELRPVSGDGYMLPLEPSAAPLDLPIVRGPVETESGFVADPGMRELILALSRMDRTRSEFMSLVSEVGPAAEGGYRFLLLPGSGADVVLLPRAEPLRALDRVSIALGQIEDRRVARADARFSGQVVLTRVEER